MSTINNLVRSGKVRYIAISKEQVASTLDRSMAQVALNWVANRPGVSSLLIGVTKLSQLNDNLQALDFTIPTDLLTKLDTVSAPETYYPYNFLNLDYKT